MLNNEENHLTQKDVLTNIIVAKVIAFNSSPISHIYKAPEKRVMMADSKEDNSILPTSSKMKGRRKNVR